MVTQSAIRPHATSRRATIGTRLAYQRASVHRVRGSQLLELLAAKDFSDSVCGAGQAAARRRLHDVGG
jgi:hypothetical protein